jgi:hypothetical protein
MGAIGWGVGAAPKEECNQAPCPNTTFTGYTVGVVGLASGLPLLGAGLPLLAVGVSDENALRAGLDGPVLQARARRRALAGKVLTIIGGVGTGLVLLEGLSAFTFNPYWAQMMEYTAMVSGLSLAAGVPLWVIGSSDQKRLLSASVAVRGPGVEVTVRF